MFLQHIPVLNTDNHRVSAYGRVYVIIFNDCQLFLYIFHLPSYFFHLILEPKLFRKSVNPYFARKTLFFFVRIGILVIFVETGLLLLDGPFTTGRLVVCHNRFQCHLNYFQQNPLLFHFIFLSLQHVRGEIRTKKRSICYYFALSQYA